MVGESGIMAGARVLRRLFGRPKSYLPGATQVMRGMVRRENERKIFGRHRRPKKRKIRSPRLLSTCIAGDVDASDDTPLGLAGGDSFGAGAGFWTKTWASASAFVVLIALMHAKSNASSPLLPLVRAAASPAPPSALFLHIVETGSAAQQHGQWRGRGRRPCPRPRPKSGR